MNKVTLLGNLTGDPELKYSPKGTAVVEFTLAQTEKWKTESGEVRKNTFFGRCFMWGPRGEAFAQYHRKGMKALIEGRLQTEEWEDKETKKNRSATRIKVLEWHFVTSAPKAAVSSPSTPAQQTKPVTESNHEPKQAELPAPEEDDVPF